MLLTVLPMEAMYGTSAEALWHLGSPRFEQHFREAPLHRLSNNCPTHFMPKLTQGTRHHHSLLAQRINFHDQTQRKVTGL